MSRFLRPPDKYIKRMAKEDMHPERSEFMRDRDRVLYSRAFRRLSGKTQIFVSTYDDHARTRLTHTLEVSQIARTISTSLGLDVNLTEAIALGHDIGHTPFGHVGERTLNLIMNGCYEYTKDLPVDARGFKHNRQGVRVATNLETRIDRETGLNLTNYTLYGINVHTSPTWVKPSKPGCVHYSLEDELGCCSSGLTPRRSTCEGKLAVSFYADQSSLFSTEIDEPAWSFEAFIVRLSDEIAQRHHDLEDGVIAGLIDRTEAVDIMEQYFGSLLSRRDRKNMTAMKSALKEQGTGVFLQCASRFLVNLLSMNLIESSRSQLNRLCKSRSITSMSSFAMEYPKLDESEMMSLIDFSPEMREVHNRFENDLRTIILNSYQVQTMDGKASYIIRKLFEAYYTNPQQLPDKTVLCLVEAYDPQILEASTSRSLVGVARNRLTEYRNRPDALFRKVLCRTICDYIAGMTDSYALSEYHNLYG